MSARPQGRKPQSHAKPHIGEWKEIDGRVELIAARCASCGETFFPSRGNCLRCRGEAMEQVRLGGPARLTSYTVIHQVASGFSSPLVAGYAEFEPGVSVFAPIDGLPDALKPGSTWLDICVGPIRTYENGESLVAYKFRPANEQQR